MKRIMAAVLMGILCCMLLAGCHSEQPEIEKTSISSMTNQGISSSASNNSEKELSLDEKLKSNMTMEIIEPPKSEDKSIGTVKVSVPNILLCFEEREKFFPDDASEEEIIEILSNMDFDSLSTYDTVIEAEVHSVNGHWEPVDASAVQQQAINEMMDIIVIELLNSVGSIDVTVPEEE